MNKQEDYWNRKIKEWSEASYEKRAKNPIEIAASFFRGGITGRMDVALEVIGPKAKDKVILDMGCGLGDFCFDILKYGPKKVIGLDISSVAVKEAQKRAKSRGVAGRVKFLQGDASQIKKLPGFDIAVGLGFIDYFDKEGLKKVFKVISNRQFFFSMFEKKLSLLNVLHVFYVKIQGCPGSYKYTRREMRKIIPKDAKSYFFERDGLLFITNLPRKNK